MQPVLNWSSRAISWKSKIYWNLNKENGTLLNLPALCRANKKPLLGHRYQNGHKSMKNCCFSYFIVHLFSACCRKGMAFYQHQSAKSDAVTHNNRCIKLLIQIPPAIHWTQTPSYVTTLKKKKSLKIKVCAGAIMPHEVVASSTCTVDAPCLKRKKGKSPWPLRPTGIAQTEGGNPVSTIPPFALQFKWWRFALF